MIVEATITVVRGRLVLMMMMMNVDKAMTGVKRQLVLMMMMMMIVVNGMAVVRR